MSIVQRGDLYHTVIRFVSEIKKNNKTKNNKKPYNKTKNCSTCCIQRFLLCVGCCVCQSKPDLPYPLHCALFVCLVFLVEGNVSQDWPLGDVVSLSGVLSGRERVTGLATG